MTKEDYQSIQLYKAALRQSQSRRSNKHVASSLPFHNVVIFGIPGIALAFGVYALLSFVSSFIGYILSH